MSTPRKKKMVATKRPMKRVAPANESVLTQRQEQWAEHKDRVLAALDRGYLDPWLEELARMANDRLDQAEGLADPVPAFNRPRQVAPATPRRRYVPVAGGDTPTVKAGVFRRTSDQAIFRVVEAKRTPGRFYAKEAVFGPGNSVDFHYDKGAIFTLDESMRMSQADVDRLALKYDTCFVCGRKLTAEESRRRGIGPVCRRRQQGVTP